MARPYFPKPVSTPMKPPPTPTSRRMSGRLAKICPHCWRDRRALGRLKANPPGSRTVQVLRLPQALYRGIGTIFESSHLALHLWLQAIHLMCASKKGITTRQLQRMLQCSMKTAWFLSHRIREAMADTSGPIGGEGSTVEIDETYVGGKAANRHLGKRGGGAGRERLKAPVFALVERGGKARAVHVPWVTGENLTQALEMNAKAGTKIYSDENHTTRFAARHFAGDSVNHKAGEYVRDDVYTNTVEGFFAIVKRGLTGVYHSVSDEHLDRYLSEFAFRYSNRSALGVEDVQRADRSDWRARQAVDL